MPGALIIQTAFLGDVVLATPLIQAAAERFSPLDVSILTIPAGAQALGHPSNPIDGLKDIIVYDKRGADRGLGAFFRLVGQLKERRFDVALVPHRSIRSAALALFAGIPTRVGFDRNAPGPWFTHRVKRPMEKHDVERNLALLEPFGGPPDGFVPKLEVAMTAEGREKAQSIIKKLPRRGPLAGVAPGSVWGAKRWLAENFAVVMDEMAREKGASFVIIGGERDLEAAASVAKKANASHVNLAGKTTVPEMVALIEALDIFITNDSGPMHIAAALGVPVVAVFGATTPALGFAPYTDKARVVEPSEEVPCRPCNAHGPKKCPEGHFDCMAKIKPEQVIEAVYDLMG